MDDDQRTPTHLAAFHGSNDALELLVRNCSELDRLSMGLKASALFDHGLKASVFFGRQVSRRFGLLARVLRGYTDCLSRACYRVRLRWRRVSGDCRQSS